jgi:pimeloyl-ACP methyl ester carboxylesterase
MQEVLKKGQPVHLIGASFGGLVGWAFDPGLLLSLTTIGSLPEKTASARNSGLLARLVPRLPELPYRILYGLKTARSLQKDGPDLQNLAIPSQDSLARRLTAISRWELSKQPPVSITCIWGQEDEFVRWTESSVRKLGFTPAVVPGGHFPHLSHPDAVCAVLSPEVLK